YVMFLINQFFSFIAIAVTVLIYVVLVRSRMRESLPDVRRGLFVFMAEQATKIAEKFPYHPKIWKPNLLIPVEDPRNWAGMMEFIRTIAYPRGRAEFFTIVDRASEDGKNPREETLKLLSEVTAPLKEEGLFVSTLAVESNTFLESATALTQTLASLALAPNVLFIKLGFDAQKDPALTEYLARIATLNLGIVVFRLHPKAMFGQKQTINLWVRRGSPNIHLAILVSLQLESNWEGKLRLIHVAAGGSEQLEAQRYLEKLKRVMRLPAESEAVVLVGSFDEALAQAPLADINIFGLPQKYVFVWMRNVSNKISTSALFLKDSEQESAVV
ncbi:MAG: hypothetical protein V1863_05115, partial [Candidatus Omnitrophota bacterium]